MKIFTIDYWDDFLRGHPKLFLPSFVLFLPYMLLRVILITVIDFFCSLCGNMRSDINAARVICGQGEKDFEVSVEVELLS